MPYIYFRMINEGIHPQTLLNFLSWVRVSMDIVKCSPFLNLSLIVLDCKSLSWVRGIVFFGIRAPFVIVSLHR